MTLRAHALEGFDIVEAGEGPPLVLLHSLLTDRTLFDAVVEPLSRRCRVILPNLPGFGTTPPVTEPSIFAYADHVAAIFDKLALPATTAVLGNGFGGFVASAFALKYGSRFGKLMLVDTGPGFPEPAKQPLRNMAAGVEARGMEAVLDTAVARMFPPEYVAANPAVIEGRKAVLRAVAPGPFAVACRTLAALDFTPRLAEIRNPTLVIVGLEDMTTPPALSRALRDGIPGAGYVEIEDCGHCPPIQAPERLVAEIESFTGFTTLTR